MMLVFAYQATLGREQYELFVLRWAIIPVEITENSDFLPTTPIPLAGTLLTALFLHTGLRHLATNLALLALFGLRSEPRIGSLRALALFLLGGLAGGLAQLAADPSSLVPVVGASGAIASLMVATLLRTPWSLLHGCIFVAWVAIAAQGLAAELRGNIQIGSGPAVWSHLAGLALGALAAVLGPAWVRYRQP